MLIKSEDDDLRTETRFSRTSSYTNADADSDSYQQQRPRRVASAASLFTLSAGGRRSSSQGAGRDDSDTYVTSRLCFNMWRYLGLQMDHMVSCPWVLCFPSFSWFCSSCFSLLPL